MTYGIRIYSVGVWNYTSQWTLPQTLPIRIYSVGVWNLGLVFYLLLPAEQLEFTPLEFETH